MKGLHNSGQQKETRMEQKDIENTVDLELVTKFDAYRKIVPQRKECRLCAGLINPAEVEAGLYDSDQIGPWSRWQGNLDASLLLVGQDWGDVSYFLSNRGFENPGNPTNKTLIDLLKSIGIDIGPPAAAHGQHVAFFTNAILCLKQGGLQAEVQKEWFTNGSPLLRRQVEIVEPKVVVGLGEMAFGSILRSFGMKPPAFRSAVENHSGTLLPNGTIAFAVYHCGMRIQNTHRPLEQQFLDWRRIGKALFKEKCS